MDQVQNIINKFKTQGFNKLTIEDLLITQRSLNWKSEFRTATGQDWQATYQPRALQRIKLQSVNPALVASRADIDTSPILVAAASGDLPGLQRIVNQNNIIFCINALDDSGKNCVHFAAKQGHGEVCRYLIQQGWPIDQRDRLGMTPLHYACMHNNPGVVQILLEFGADPAIQDNICRNALILACCAQDLTIIQVLLNYQLQLITSQDMHGRGPLHYAVFNQSSQYVKMIQILLQAGCDVNMKDQDDRTPLHHACLNGRTKCFGALLKGGASLDIVERIQNKTPLQICCNDRVRQRLQIQIVPDPEPGQDDIEYFNTVLQGVVLKQEVQQPEPINPIIDWPERLKRLLRKVQNLGVQNQQHLKKPFMYSGSWMEGIFTIQGLMQSLNSCNPCEAVQRVFNVLYPYNKELPVANTDESNIGFFYGENWNREVAQADLTQLKELNQIIEQKDEEIADQTQQILQLKSNYEVLQMEMKVLQEKQAKEVQSLSNQISVLQDSLLQKDDSIAALQSDLTIAQSKVKGSQSRLNKYFKALEDFQQERTQLLQTNIKTQAELEDTQKQLTMKESDLNQCLEELKSRPSVEQLEQSQAFAFKLIQKGIDPNNTEEVFQKLGILH